MEIRIQDKEIGIPSSLDNEDPTLTRSQTLDQHHQQHQQHQSGGLRREEDQNPDRVPFVDAVSSATGAPHAVGSNIKSQPPPPPPTTVTTTTTTTIRYGECLKNHAASVGGHVVDGCGEFMPTGEEGTFDALRCAACNCHRNFHRREIDGDPQRDPNSYYISYNPSNKNESTRRLPPPPPPPHLHSSLSLPPPRMVAFGGNSGGGATESSSDDLHVYQSSAGAGPSIPPPLKKRFRTKFTQEQKDKMLEFAEKLGWRIQKQDEPELQQFCAEVSVKRQVLKVWMHNNKHSMKKKHL